MRTWLKGSTQWIVYMSGGWATRADEPCTYVKPLLSSTLGVPHHTIVVEGMKNTRQSDRLHYGYHFQHSLWRFLTPFHVFLDQPHTFSTGRSLCLSRASDALCAFHGQMSRCDCLKNSMGVSAGTRTGHISKIQRRKPVLDP